MWIPDSSGLRHVLAQPPDISETFLREVDENLRRDRMRDFVKKYGNWLIAARRLVPRRQRRLHLVAAASGQQQSEKQVEQLAADLQGYRHRQHRARRRSSSMRFRTAAARRCALRHCSPRPRSRSSRTTSSSPPPTISEIAGDGGLPQPYRDAALIRQTALEFDQLQPDEVIARLEPLAKPGEPWFGSAGEMTALALIKQGKKQEAGTAVRRHRQGQGRARAIRARAVQSPASLGVDASAALQPQAQ